MTKLKDYAKEFVNSKATVSILKAVGDAKTNNLKGGAQCQPLIS